MAVYTIYPTNDGHTVSSAASTWATIQSSTPAATSVTNSLRVEATTNGFNPSLKFEEAQGFMTFDTSGVVGTITSVTLTMYLNNRTVSGSVPAFDVIIHPTTYTGAVDISDKKTSSTITATNLLSNLANSSLSAASASYTWPTSSNFVGSINQSGNTQIVLTTSHFTGTTSIGASGTGTSRYIFDYSGAANPPYLTITTTDPSSGAFYPRIIYI